MYPQGFVGARSYHSSTVTLTPGQPAPATYTSPHQRYFQPGGPQPGAVTPQQVPYYVNSTMPGYNQQNAATYTQNGAFGNAPTYTHGGYGGGYGGYGGYGGGYPTGPGTVPAAAAGTFVGGPAGTFVGGPAATYTGGPGTVPFGYAGY